MKSVRPRLLAGMVTAGVAALAGMGLGDLKMMVVRPAGEYVRQIQFAGPSSSQIVMLATPTMVPAILFTPLLPGESASYSFVSAASGGTRGACMESVKIIAMGPGQAPKVVSRRAGDCAGGSLFGQSQAALTPSAAAPVPKLIRARVEMPVSLPRPFPS